MKSAVEAPSGARRWGAAAAFAVALAARLAVVAWAAARIPPVADGAFYDTIARRIAQGLGYTWLWPDGAVTYAGHYPIGYPALTAAAYFVAGPRPVAAMVANALLGALAAAAAYRLAEQAAGRRSAVIAGALVALHPGLVAYTPALMTEGVTAALLVCGAWAAGSEMLARYRPWARPLVVGLVLGAATLVRPQSLALAPIFGALAASTARPGEPSRRAWMRRAGGALLALAAALVVCAPWTVRNCERMKRCALVSYNGGWNLLIGADEASTGSWSEIKVPPECREVYDEADKDVCFGGAARRFIVERPGAWLALAPKKLAATFDYAGAGPWYLHAANPGAFTEENKVQLGAVETLFERVMVLLALAAGARGAAARYRARRAGGASIGGAFKAGAKLDGLIVAAALLGAVATFQRHGWIAHIFLIFVLFVGWPPAPATEKNGALPRPLLPIAAAIVLLSLVVTHAVFFGAGRYSLVAFPLVTAAAALAFAPKSPTF